jgi:ribosomal protein L24E
MKTPKLSSNAAAFVAANKRSAVVFGAAIGQGGQGAIYVLRNGKSFRLTADECAAIGMPRWAEPPRKAVPR